MGVPEALRNVWDEAIALREKGDADASVSLLRESAWGLCETDAHRARTCCLAADSYTALGESDEANRKKHWQNAYKNYTNSLKFDAKNKETRRKMNKLTGQMDEVGVSLGTSLQIMDDGSPTPLGLLVMVIAGMVLLTAFKVISDAMVEVEYQTATLEVSYVPSGGEEADRVTASIVIDLHASDAPIHVDNFVATANNGDFDHTIFHRIIDGFMIQGGDFTKNDGTGGHAAKWYGYCNGKTSDSAGNAHTENTCRLDDWTIPDEADNGLKHKPGSLAMAKTSAENTGGSQFYIVPEDSTPSHLDGVHTVFGSVVSGLSHVTAISDVETGSNDRPIHEVRLVSVDIA